MKKQIVFIHGGEAFSDYNAYLAWLEKKPLGNPLEERPKFWKHMLKETLEDEYDVFMPGMPSPGNAKYEEWKIWFERHFEFLRNGVVLIGHSQGGVFLAKYLSENKVPVRVHAVYLIAAPIEKDDFGGEDGGDFMPDTSLLEEGMNQADVVYILHSKDDPIVPFRHAEKYHELLPEAEKMTFDDRGHFLMEAFPELFESIRSLK